MSNIFDKERLDFYLPDAFKGLSKKYMLSMIFDETIQSKWCPEVGDIIVTTSGNIYVISGKFDFDKSLGGTMYYFGGGPCARDGGIMNSTFCYSANESGKYIHPVKGEISNSNHSCIREFKYIPYPHELNK